MRLIPAPSANGTVIKWLPHLLVARRRDGPLCLVELQTRRIPGQAEERDQAAALGLKIADQGFVVDFKDAVRQNRPPVIGQTFDFQRPRGAFLLIVSPVDAVVELRGETGDADIP